MSTNEETMLTFVDKLISDPTTPTVVLEMCFKQAMETDNAKVIQKLMLSGLIEGYFNKNDIADMLISTFAKFKQYKIAELFLLKENRRDMRIKLTYEHYKYLLRYASFDGQIKVVQLLLNIIDPSEGDNYSFMNAVRNNQIEIVKLLLTDKRIDPQIKNNQAIRKAFQSGYIEIVKLLIPLVDISKIHITEIHKIKKEMDPKSDDYEEAKILLGMISEERAKNTTIFYNIGMYLVNIDHRLFKEWIEFNRCHSKETCEEWWNTLKQGLHEECTIGELRLLAFKDNPKKFMDYQNSKSIITNKTETLTTHESTSLHYHEGEKNYIDSKTLHQTIKSVDKNIIELINKNKIKTMECSENRIYVSFEDGSKYCCC